MMKTEHSNELSQTIGNRAEKAAEDYLIAAGLITITRNYRCKQGEIDLIMREGNQLVFVEVRYRKNAIYGSALETVNYSKRKKIIAATQHYLLANSVSNAIRFDVVGITGDDIQWIPSAFQST